MVILTSFVAIACLAILLESAPASVVRVIAISFCILLLVSMAAGLWARSRVKKRRAREMASEWLDRIEEEDRLEKADGAREQAPP